MTTFQPNTEGIFQIPEEVYRSAPGISQSTLKDFAASATPAHFKQSLEEPDEPTPEMEFGTVLHAHVLQPESAADSFYLRPDTYPAKVKNIDVQKPWHGGAEWCKEWLSMRTNKPVLKAAAAAKIPAIVARVQAIPEAGSVIVNGQRELSFFKRDEETGLLLKARVDAIATDKNGLTWLVDLKKVRRGFASETEFAKTVFDRGYDVQDASYRFITGASRMIFVAIESEPPYEVQQHALNEEFLSIGYSRWRAALLRYHQCALSGEWPGYSGGIRLLPPPARARRAA